MKEVIRKTEAVPIRFRELPWAWGYWVGEDGSVFSARSRGKYERESDEWTSLSLYRRPYGSRYFVVCIRPEPGGTVVQKYVHRLVLEVFVGPASGNIVCRHLDGDTSNNRLENLKWGSIGENVEDKKQHGTFVARWMTVDGKRRVVADVARERGINPQTVRNRILRFGWDAEKALSTPVIKRGKRAKQG